MTVWKEGRKATFKDQTKDGRKATFKDQSNGMQIAAI